ncbi:MAG: protein kinase [Planctomycetes bacterium]|nr:protein kinase [Planctomycetota bacterium]MBL7143262.1 protein kinase [Phycisphaerae bacterium]
MTQESSFFDKDAELLVAEVAEDFLRRIEQGENPEVADYAARYPSIAENLRQILPVLTMVGASQDVWLGRDQVCDKGMPQERILGDFKILREVGRGGMGVVYEARELSLGRRVALKVLPFVAVLDPHQLKRFKMEAQIAACLHHTNIVPVFSVGCERGVYYYAMQYIEGHSLASIIHELRQYANNKTPVNEKKSRFLKTGLSDCAKCLLTVRSTHSSEFVRSVAQLCIQVAEALQYAHDMGVVHRDIKPSNIMLDERGHPWITDFGLAQYRTNTATVLTRPGDVLGTIRYMSPEQVAGNTTMVDHRTDIYALGATLFELLSLEPVFAHQERHRLMNSIEMDEPRSLHLLNPAVPKDLETIVLKAMAKDPVRRYTSSKALAEDLRRFLDHRTIEARRPSMGECLAKWARRHRALVNAVAGVLVVAVVALSLSTVIIWQEKARTEAALTQVEAERQRAQTHYEQAREAMDEITYIVEQQSTNFAAVKETRRELLQKAQRFYEGLLETNSQEPNVMNEMCQSYHRIGSIHMQLGQYDEAEKAYTSAIDIGNRVHKIKPDHPHMQSLLGDCIEALSEALREQGKLAESVERQRQAIEIFEQICVQRPNDRNHQDKLLNTYKRLAETLKWMEEPEQVIQATEQVMELEREFIGRYPDQILYQTELAIHQAELAQIIWVTGQRNTAVEQAYEAVERMEHIASKCPDQLNLQYSHVRARIILADLLRRRERTQEAAEHYARAKEFHEHLLSLPVEDSSHLWLRSWNEMVLACFQLTNGQTDEALEIFLQANQHKEEAIALEPHNHDYLRSTAADCFRLGFLLAEQGRFDEAEQTYVRAKSLCEQLALETPDYFEQKGILVSVHIGLCNLQQRTGHHEEALKSIQQAMKLQEEFVRTCPISSPWGRRLGWGPGYLVLRHLYILMGRMLAELGQAEEASETLQKAADIDINENDAPIREFLISAFGWSLYDGK